MRRVLALIVSTLFIFSLSGMSYAAEKETKVTLLAAGAVKTIDANAKSVTISSSKQPDFTFSVSKETVVRSNDGRNVTFADIKVGAILALSYEVVDGKNIAKSVTVADQVTAAPEKKGQTKISE